MPIGVLNVICLCDNDKRGCNVMVVLRGSTEPAKPGCCNESTGKLVRRVDISIGDASTAQMPLTVPSRLYKPCHARPHEYDDR